LRRDHGFLDPCHVEQCGSEGRDSDSIFVAQAGSAPRTPQGGPRAQLRWLGPSRLLVTYDYGAVIAFQAIRARGLEID
jgi:hypothetical protein